MSASGTKRTSRDVCGLTAFGGKADMPRGWRRAGAACGRINMPQCSSLALMLPLDVEPIICDASNAISDPLLFSRFVSLLHDLMQFSNLEDQRPTDERSKLLRCA